MSKRFKTQDYFRYKRLGKRWRRPVGLQSKLRVKKGGSGMKVAVGYGTAAKPQPILVRNEKDFEKDCSSGVIISSSVGAKKTIKLAAKAKELGLTVVNMKKVKRASKLQSELEKKKQTKKKEATKEKTEKKEESEEKTKAETTKDKTEKEKPQDVPV